MCCFRDQCTIVKNTVNTFYSRRLNFRINSREHRDAKIKSLPIISNVSVIEQDLTNCENVVSWKHAGWWPRENKVTRIISILQYVKIARVKNFHIYTINIMYSRFRVWLGKATVHGWENQPCCVAALGKVTGGLYSQASQGAGVRTCVR